MYGMTDDLDALWEKLEKKDKRIEELEAQIKSERDYIRSDTVEELLSDAMYTIKQLEAERDYWNSIVDTGRSSDGVADLMRKIAELEAKLDRVRGLPEKWQHHVVSDLDSSFWSAISTCTDDVKSALGDEDGS